MKNSNTITKSQITKLIGECFREVISGKGNKKKSVIKESFDDNGVRKGHYITITIKPQGGALLELTAEGRDCVENDYNPDESDDVLAFVDLCDDIRGNSDWFFGSADQLGQMSEAPCFCTHCGYGEESDELEMAEDSRLFYYGDYQVSNFIEALMNGPVVFTEAYNPI